MEDDTSGERVADEASGSALLSEELHARLDLAHAETRGPPEEIELARAKYEAARLKRFGGDPARVALEDLKRELSSLSLRDGRQMLDARFRSMPAEELLTALGHLQSALIEEEINAFERSAVLQARALFAKRVLERVRWTFHDLLRSARQLDPIVESLATEEVRAAPHMRGWLEDETRAWSDLRKIDRAIEGIESIRAARHGLLLAAYKYACGWYDELGTFRRIFPVAQLQVSDEAFVEVARVLAGVAPGEDSRKWARLADIFAELGLGKVGDKSLKAEWIHARKAEGLRDPEFDFGAEMPNDATWVVIPRILAFREKSSRWFAKWKRYPNEGPDFLLARR